MNWEAIGAVGEVVGAVGVIASLAYLSIQIRQNTRQIRQNIEASQISSYNQAQEQTWQVGVVMAQDAVLSSIYARFLDEGLDALTTDEQLRIGSGLGTFFHGIDSLFLLHEKGLLDPENWENILENQIESWSNPNVIAYIRSRPGPIRKRFAAVIEKRLGHEGHAA